MKAELNMDNLEIGKKYFVWEKTHTYIIFIIKINKVTPKKIYYETLNCSADNKYYHNNYNYSTQILKANITGGIFENLQDCKASVSKYIKEESDRLLNRVQELKNIKKNLNEWKNES